MLHNNEINLTERAARKLTLACGILFFVFSMVWLYVFQGDLLGALFHHLSGSSDGFSPFWASLVITLMLLLLRWGINVLLGLKGAVRTLSYFPSFLLLGVITDVPRSVYTDGIEACWLWLFPLLLLLYVSVSFTLRRWFRGWFDAAINIRSMVFSNLTLFVAMCFIPPCIGNTDADFHHELGVEAALRRGDYERACRIGMKTLHPSPLFVALHAYALAQNEVMGECLFAFPPPDGAEGLLIPDESLLITADSLSALWKCEGRKESESAADYFSRIYHAHRDSSVHSQYYFMSLLLDKRLEQFVTEAVSAVPDMPLHYREALYLYAKLNPEAGVSVNDGQLDARWSAFEADRLTYAHDKAEANRMRRKYGDTYWWYYFYSAFI